MQHHEPLKDKRTKENKMFEDLPPLSLVLLALPFIALYTVDVSGILLLPLALYEYHYACNSLANGTVAGLARRDATTCVLTVDVGRWAADLVAPCYAVLGASPGQNALVHYNARSPAECARLVTESPSPEPTLDASVFFVNAIAAAWALTLAMAAAFLAIERLAISWSLRGSHEA